jgi:hypothetical protein
MFEDFLKSLRQLDGMKMSVPVAAEADSDGFVDRQCPATECEFLFKVQENDWRDIVSDEAVWCPFCGQQAKSDEWFTHEQIEKAKEAAFAEIKHTINQALRRDAERFNRRQSRRSFISMSMKVNSKPEEIVLPAAATDPMQLKIKCPDCACRYAAIGSAYFCPACGHNTADLVFNQSSRTIRATLDNLPAIAAGLPSRDDSSNIIRLLTEDSLQRVVTAFQRFAEALYAKLPGQPAPRRNAFQNLNKGSKLWQAAYGETYNKHLSTAELDLLNRLFLQRHLLAHREGLVDENYIAKTGDQNYREGQRLVVKEGAVRECVALIEKLGNGLATDAK